MAMLESIVYLLLLMLILIILLLLWVFKPWRFFLARYRTNNKIPLNVGDLEKPLVSEDSAHIESENDLARNFDLEGACIKGEGNFSSSGAHGLVCKQRFPSMDVHVTQGASFDPDVIIDQAEDLLVGQTLKRPLARNYTNEEQKYARKEGSKDESTFDAYTQNFKPTGVTHQSSGLILEVMSGPSCGLQCSIDSTTSKSFTLGRVPPSDLLLKDAEVSGKHAIITWNTHDLKWELVDMGSLNGTYLNSHAIHHPDTGSRQWSGSFELSDGDIITLGTTSKVLVHITPEQQIPFGVGMASDPMALRRGGKKLPMEDVCYYLWPLPGIEKFGLFGICDGHGGAGASKVASKMLPERIASILSIVERREKVLSQCDATDVLMDAFSQTEAALHHQYEGCTATVLLVWADGHETFCVQCANVGDSACIMNVNGKLVKMTEDHRVSSQSEKLRLMEKGQPIKDGETRLCGLNLARMLGDKFLKEQDGRFSSEPYISEVVHVDKQSEAFVLMASDGLWDVISPKKAIQLVLQTRERYASDTGNRAEKITNFVLSEASTLRTKDNTSIIFIDFDTAFRTGSCKDLS